MDTADSDVVLVDNEADFVIDPVLEVGIHSVAEKDISSGPTVILEKIVQL